MAMSLRSLFPSVALSTETRRGKKTALTRAELSRCVLVVFITKYFRAMSCLVVSVLAVSPETVRGGFRDLPCALGSRKGVNFQRPITKKNPGVQYNRYPKLVYTW